MPWHSTERRWQAEPHKLRRRIFCLQLSTSICGIIGRRLEEEEGHLSAYRTGSNVRYIRRDDHRRRKRRKEEEEREKKHRVRIGVIALTHLSAAQSDQSTAAKERRRRRCAQRCGYGIVTAICHAIVEEQTFLCWREENLWYTRQYMALEVNSRASIHSPTC